MRLLKSAAYPVRLTRIVGLFAFRDICSFMILMITIIIYLDFYSS